MEGRPERARQLIPRIDHRGAAVIGRAGENFEFDDGCCEDRKANGDQRGACPPE